MPKRKELVATVKIRLTLTRPLACPQNQWYKNLHKINLCTKDWQRQRRRIAKSATRVPTSQLIVTMVLIMRKKLLICFSVPVQVTVKRKRRDRMQKARRRRNPCDLVQAPSILFLGRKVMLKLQLRKKCLQEPKEVSKGRRVQVTLRWASHQENLFQGNKEICRSSRLR